MQAELAHQGGAEAGGGALQARLGALEAAAEELRGAVRAAVAEAAAERGASSVWLAAIEVRQPSPKNKLSLSQRPAAHRLSGSWR